MWETGVWRCIPESSWQLRLQSNRLKRRRIMVGERRTVSIDIPPSFIQSIWFQILCALVILLLLSLVYVLRFRQVNAQIRARLYERVAERERIARELHDTLLQGVLSASMQLDLAEDQLAGDSPVKGLVQSVLATLRHVTEESRMALRGLRFQDVESNDLAKAFQRVKQEFSYKDAIVFRVVAQGDARVVRTEIRDEICRIGREAIVNAYVHSEAATIEVEIQYARTHRVYLCGTMAEGLTPRFFKGVATVTGVCQESPAFSTIESVQAAEQTGRRN